MSIKTILVLIISMFLSQAMAGNSELHLRVDNELVQLILNDAVKQLEDQDQHIIRSLPNISQELNFNLNSLNIDADLKEYTRMSAA